MSWKEVVRLQKLSCSSLALSVVKTTEQKVLNIFSRVDEAQLKLLKDGDDVINCECSKIQKKSIYDEKNRICLHCVTDEIVNLFKICRHWWSCLPRGSTKLHLFDALDYHTETNSSDEDEFIQYICRIFLKLLILDEIFIDRDYSDKDKKCLIPFKLEQWVCLLLRRLEPLPVIKISIYGAMYPSITETIIQSCPNITVLILSHINITDDLLFMVGKTCQNLEKLQLQHCYPWMVLSVDGFCKAFFKEQCFDHLKYCLKNKLLDQVEITFTKLKELELSYGPTSSIKDIHLLILCFYKNVDFIFSRWKSSFFESGYENYCEDVMQEAISSSGSLSIRHLFLKADYLFDLNFTELNELSWNCPLLREIAIDCKTSRSRSNVSSVRKIGSKLSQFCKENKSVKGLYANVAREDRFTRSILLPFFLSRASTLTDVTLEASAPGENISVTMLKLVIDTCSALETLRVRVWNRSMVEFPSAGSDKIFFPRRKSLTEIWLHEEGPGEDDEEMFGVKLWLNLLNGLVKAAPDLNIFSFTVCEGLINILDQLTTEAKCIHVHIKDGYEWQPCLAQLHRFISMQPNLQDLYLEEISNETFWKLKEQYMTSQLNLHWGNLEGWPRS